ncbi:hypothetical protein [Dongia sp.]|uniref:hypothetical protein n=1 Tax=Dongia sp. TaxID=1977262 RepID=UPI0037513C3D
MNASNLPIMQQGLSNLSRPRFSPGLLLEDEDLTAGVDYTRNLMKLMFSSLFGCGVVCGLKVTAVSECDGRRLGIKIGRGLALDCAGNPINLPDDVSFPYDPGCEKMPKELWVSVCYIEKCCRKRDVSCAPDDEGEAVYTRAVAGFEVRVCDKQPKCACACLPKQTQPPRQQEGCCEEHAERNAAQPGISADATAEDFCRCYDDHINGVCGCDCGCECVVIGKLDAFDIATKNEKKDIPADSRMVRNIRPMLMGHWNCIKPKQKDEASAPPPGDGTRPPRG